LGGEKGLGGGLKGKEKSSKKKESKDFVSNGIEQKTNSNGKGSPRLIYTVVFGKKDVGKSTQGPIKWGKKEKGKKKSIRN